MISASLSGHHRQSSKRPCKTIIEWGRASKHPYVTIPYKNSQVVLIILTHWYVDLEINHVKMHNLIYFNPMVLPYLIGVNPMGSMSLALRGGGIGWKPHIDHIVGPHRLSQTILNICIWVWADTCTYTKGHIYTYKQTYKGAALLR